ncbi:MAG: UbiA family prenyltransferase [Candidatus Caldarchaeum sp.]
MRLNRSKLVGFAGLNKSYFSLFTSPFLALLTTLLVGVSAPAEVFSLGVYFLLATAFLNSYNNVMDVKSDALTKQGFPIPAGVITSAEAMAYSTSLAMLSVIVALRTLFVQIAAGAMLLLDLLLAFLYSTPKVRLKRFPVVKGSTLVSHTFLIPFIVAVLLTERNLLSYSMVIPPIFLMGLGIHTVQDIGDVRGDRFMGDKTIPLLFGTKKAVVFALSLVLSALMYVVFLEVQLKTLAILSLLAQTAMVSLLLFREELWKNVFWGSSAVSFLTLASLLYRCCV